MGRKLTRWNAAPYYLLLLVSCFAAARLGLFWADRATATIAFWPAAGVALYGVRRLGAPAASMVSLALLPAFMMSGLDAGPSLIIALTNGAAAALSAEWLRRRMPAFGNGDTVSLRLFGELLLVAMGASLMGGLAGIAAIWRPELGLGVALRIGAGGFLAHFAGTAVVAPFCGAWLTRRSGTRPMPLRAKMHLAATLGLIALACWPVFLTTSLPLRTWHLYPLLIWAALAFRARGATAGILITTIAATAGTVNSLGPFGPNTNGVYDAILLTQQFIIFTTIIIGVLAEVADERRSLNALRAARQRLDFALDAAGMVGWDFDAVDRRIRPVGNVDSFYGRPIRSADDLALAVHPDDRDGIVRAATEALSSDGQDYEFEYRVLLADGTIRNVLARGRSTVLRGQPPTLSGIALDVTARRRDEERQKLLMAELDHRVKNILATIQALISRTATDKTSVAELASTLKGRVQAMARAHSMLARNRWEGALLGGLLLEEFSPYGQDRIRLEGPDIHLSPRAALSLSLVLHELATNAAKYGALSAPGGQVEVRWGVGRGNTAMLALDWRESGGPSVAEPPKRRGFGSVMTERVIRHELGGTLDFDYQPGGLVCRIALPLDRVGRSTAAASSLAPETPAAPAPAGGIKGLTIMVVEDSPIIAGGIEAQLIAAGATVLGPYLRLADALVAAEGNALAAALLDVNLGDEMVFPLADRLVERGVPFVFATGYGDDTVMPERYRNRARLLKPFTEEALVAALATAAASRNPNPNEAVTPV